MEERPKRIRNKTKRYISTDEEKYEYKKKKKNNIDVQETFNYIKKALFANGRNNKKNFEKHSESDEDIEEDEQREITIEKEHVPCKNTSNSTIQTLSNTIMVINIQICTEIK